MGGLRVWGGGVPPSHSPGLLVSQCQEWHGDIELRCSTTMAVSMATLPSPAPQVPEWGNRGTHFTSKPHCDFPVSSGSCGGNKVPTLSSKIQVMSSFKSHLGSEGWRHPP